MSSSLFGAFSVFLVFIIVAVVTSPLTLVDASPADDQGTGGAKKQHIRITTVEEQPYVIKKPNASVPPKNSDFEGFIPELLGRLATELQFDYTISLCADGKYGGKSDSGQWNGMIGEVHSGTADLAAAAITVSDERKTVVDFTRPFMTFDSAILMKKTTGDNSSMTIKSLADLADQSTITYGVIRDGVTESFFRRSAENNPLYKRMWQVMSAGTGTGVANAKEGIKRVRESYAGRPYAFITEGSTADFWVNSPPCEFVSVGVTMFTRNYALAAKKNWPTRDAIDNALNRMDQSGDLEQLRRKWWKSGACSAQNGGTRAGNGDVTATGFRLLVQLLAMFVVGGMSSTLVFDRK